MTVIEQCWNALTEAEELSDEQHDEPQKLWMKFQLQLTTAIVMAILHLAGEGDHQ